MNEPTIQITGRVGSDPELKFTPSGKPVCNFSVAQTPRIKKNDAWEDGETIWFRVSVWGFTAEAVVESVTKGALVAIFGRLNQRTYDAKTGEKKTELGVEAETVAIVPTAKQPPQASAPQTQPEVAPW